MERTVAPSQSASLCVVKWGEKRKEDYHPACSVGSQCLSQERKSRGEKMLLEKILLVLLCSFHVSQRSKNTFLRKAFPRQVKGENHKAWLHEVDLLAVKSRAGIRSGKVQLKSRTHHCSMAENLSSQAGELEPGTNPGDAKQPFSCLKLKSSCLL